MRRPHGDSDSKELEFLGAPALASRAGTSHWRMLKRIHQQVAQPVSAFEIGIHEFESNFVHSGPA